MAKFDDMSTDELLAYVSEFYDDGIFAVTELIRRGVSLEKIHDITKITGVSWRPSPASWRWRAC